MNDKKQMPSYLYKLLTLAQWEIMCELGIHHTNSSELDQKDGYIHLSNAHQVERIAKKYFHDTLAVKILKLDYNKISGSIKWESNSTGEHFPHCYDEIQAESVSSIEMINVHEYNFSSLQY